MNIREKFLERIEEEHEDFLEMIDGYDTEEIVSNSGYIAKFQAIYEYLSENEALLTERQISHFLKLTNPIELIANSYNPPEEELHEEFMATCEKIVDGRLYSINCSGNVKELFERMGDELQIDRDGENLTEDKKEIFEYMLRISSVLGQHFTNSLLQFKNPLEVIQAATKGSSSLLHVTSETEEYIDNHDIFTLPHKLDYDRLLDESKWRHDAINEITNIIPRPDFESTMNWINFFRTLEDIGIEFEDDPYAGFVNALKVVSTNQGKEILQQIYDMEKDTMILENELVEAAKYLADGGEYNKIAELAENGFFEGPYEEVKERFADEQQQGGMDLC